MKRRDVNRQVAAALTAATVGGKGFQAIAWGQAVRSGGPLVETITAVWGVYQEFLARLEAGDQAGVRVTAAAVPLHDDDELVDLELVRPDQLDQARRKASPGGPPK